MILPAPDLEPRLQRRYKKLVTEHMNTSEVIASGIRSLPGRGKAFASTQAAWRFYSNPSVTLEKLAEPLLDCARQSLADQCDNFALVAQDWTDLHYPSHSSKPDRIKLGRDFGYKLHTSLLLSDRSGLPLAPVSLSLFNTQGVLTTRSAKSVADIAQLDDLINVMQYLDNQQWGKPAVHIIDREGDSVTHLRQWGFTGHYFLVRGKDNPTVMYEGRRQRLKEVAQQIELKNGAAVEVGANLVAQELVGETVIIIERAGCPQRQRNGEKQVRKRVSGGRIRLRLIVSQLRLPDETVLAEWMLISNLPAEVEAETISKWYYWRWSIESYFKLMKSGGHQLEQWQQESGEAIAKRLLVVAMASVVIWQLMNAKDAESERVRELLIRLSGRQVRKGQVTGSALLAGMWSLISMLDALEEYEIGELKGMARRVMPGYLEYKDG